jgi:hypothetical protein
MVSCPRGNAFYLLNWLNITYGRMRLSDRFSLISPTALIRTGQATVNQGGERACERACQFRSENSRALEEVLDHAWGCIPPMRQATTSRTLLAEGILKSAAKGERDPERLRDAALMALDA